MKKVALLVVCFAMAACSKGSGSAAPATPPNAAPATGATGQVTNPTPTPNASATPKPGQSAGPTPTVSPTPKPSTTPTPTPAPAGTVALIWNGKGVCKQDCVVSSENAAKLAGLSIRYADQKTLNGNPTADTIKAVFKDVAVVILPEGDVSKEVNAMSDAFIASTKTFIKNGGGFVTWGSGAFAVSEKIGTSNQLGLNLISGKTALYVSKAPQNRYGASIEKTTWFNDMHSFYFEGGPEFQQLPSSAEVVGRYDNQTSVSAVRSAYGSGRVFVSGTSPEAPKWWWDGTGITDTDGTDEAFAAKMIRWAAHIDL